MNWMYVLKNTKTERYYIGSTNNLERRIKQHANGHTRTTRVLGALTLVYKEEFSSILEARQREKKLKSYKSKKYIEWLINKRP
jgi:putative endonuclease